MLYEIVHRTRYSYSSTVSVSHHIARLTPRNLECQERLEQEVNVSPAPSVIAHHTDYFGNRATFFTLSTPHQTLDITARSRVQIRARDVPLPDASPPWEQARNDSSQSVRIAPEIQEFTFASTLIPRDAELADYAAASFPPGRPLFEAVLDLTRRIHQEFQFDARATTVATPLKEVIRTRRGVCQDFAQIQIGCLRSLNLAARYVSGYLETLPPPGEEKLTGSDASHAWVQVFIPSIGWIDFDPTNNVVPSERHITVAWGRDFNDVSPIRGVMVGGGQHQLSVAVDVVPLAPDTEQQQQQQQ